MHDEKSVLLVKIHNMHYHVQLEYSRGSNPEHGMVQYLNAILNQAPDHLKTEQNGGYG